MYEDVKVLAHASALVRLERGKIERMRISGRKERSRKNREGIEGKDELIDNSSSDFIRD